MGDRGLEPRTSSLSACPALSVACMLANLTCSGIWAMVGPRGIEPLTSSLSVTRSNHLSYEPRCQKEFNIFREFNFESAG